jgi:hypothetical protein
VPSARPPLYIWRLRFRLTADAVTSDAVAELELRLHNYRTRVHVNDDGLDVAMRVVGYVGPASAVGDAAQSLGHHAANSGFVGPDIVFVSAERLTARMP